MRFEHKRILLSLPVIFALAACSSETPTPGTEATATTKAAQGEDTAAEVTPAAPVAQCEASPPAVCAGPLIAMLESASLQWAGETQNNGDRRIGGTATLTLQARAAQPVYVALLNQDVALRYSPGGITMTLDNHDDENVSGISFCGFSGQSCVNTERERFIALNPGDSPVRVEMQFSRMARQSELPSLADSATAGISMQAWVIDSDPAGRQVTISAGGAPVSNGTIR